MSELKFVAMNDGCRIAFEYSPVKDAPVLVLSPSLGTNLHLFDAQMEILRRRFSLVRYDPRGHGRSDIPSGAYSQDRLGQDVVELLDSIGVERAHFLGVSLGGMTGQWLGYRAPQRIRSLILANTSAYMGPPESWSERIETVSARGVESIVGSVIERWFTSEFRSREGAKVLQISEMLRQTSPAGYAACCAAIRDMDLRPTAKLISVPTLVIAGLQDPATPPEHAEFLSENISQAKVARLDAAHLCNVEVSSAFNSVIDEFLC